MAGMWFERFVIIVTSLHRDFLPSSWAMYTPTSVEIATLAGSFGLFFTLFLIFVRFLPFIAIGEVKGVLSHGRHKEKRSRMEHSGEDQLRTADEQKEDPVLH